MGDTILSTFTLNSNKNTCELKSKIFTQVYIIIFINMCYILLFGNVSGKSSLASHVSSEVGRGSVVEISIIFEKVLLQPTEHCID